MSKYTPITMPRSKKYGNNYWKTFSKKENRIVTFYSDLEYKNWLTVEMNPNILHFCEQPYEIELIIDEKKVTSIFDMWIEYTDKREEFWEIKYSKSLEGNNEKVERTRRQIEKQQYWCDINNFGYKIRTENEIELGPEYINNLRYLAHLCKLTDSYKDVIPYKKPFINYFENVNSRKTVREIILSKILPETQEIAVLANLIYDGTIDVNLESTPFSYDTEVTLNGR